MKYTPENTAGMSVTVTLNGKPLTNVLEADDTEGYAVFALLDENGNFLFENDNIASRRLEGLVCVTVLGALNSPPSDAGEWPVTPNIKSKRGAS